MSRRFGPFRLHQHWSLVAVCLVSGVMTLALGLGFLVLPRYGLQTPPRSTWEAICGALGFSKEIRKGGAAQPPAQIPSLIAWTESTIREALAGDPQRGAFIALNCTACHGENGISTQEWIPTLAGLDKFVIYKQLADYRSGKRVGGVMGAIAEVLSPRDAADVAAYFSSLAGLPPTGGVRAPSDGRSLRQRKPAKRLVFAGDPKRGMAPCASCHGPGGYLIGVPVLATQQKQYLQMQLTAFAQGTRRNDINGPMRFIASQLTAEESEALAQYYAGELAQPPAASTASPPRPDAPHAASLGAGSVGVSAQAP
jgi:cytochrome c553